MVLTFDTRVWEDSTRRGRPGNVRIEEVIKPKDYYDNIINGYLTGTGHQCVGHGHGHGHGHSELPDPNQP